MLLRIGIEHFENRSTDVVEVLDVMVVQKRAGDKSEIENVVNLLDRLLGDIERTILTEQSDEIVQLGLLDPYPLHRLISDRGVVRERWRGLVHMLPYELIERKEHSVDGWGIRGGVFVKE